VDTTRVTTMTKRASLRRFISAHVVTHFDPPSSLRLLFAAQSETHRLGTDRGPERVPPVHDAT
jgi:hypothetical protein